MSVREPMLAGKTVAVTGAGHGLGRAYAVEIARHGGDLVLNDVDEAALGRTASAIRMNGGRTETVSGSVADWDVAAQIVRTCRDQFGAIDGLVNNAGVLHACSPWCETETQLRRTMEINVLGSWFCAVHALRQMRVQGSGSIVNITSGVLAGWAGLSAYGASKAAVAAMTAGWAAEVDGSGVRVNAVMPVAATAMSAMFGRIAPRDDTVQHPAPTRIAPLVAYLLSDHAADLNGRILRHDGRKLSLIPWPAPARASALLPVPESAEAADYRELLRALLRQKH